MKINQAARSHVILVGFKLLYFLSSKNSRSKIDVYTVDDDKHWISLFRKAKSGITKKVVRALSQNKTPKSHNKSTLRRAMAK